MQTLPITIAVVHEICWLDMVAHTCNPNTPEAEAGRSQVQS